MFRFFALSISVSVYKEVLSVYGRVLQLHIYIYICNAKLSSGFK